MMASPLPVFAVVLGLKNDLGRMTRSAKAATRQIAVELIHRVCAATVTARANLARRLFPEWHEDDVAQRAAAYRLRLQWTSVAGRLREMCLAVGGHDLPNHPRTPAIPGGAT
jgi:hypothetical protein